MDKVVDIAEVSELKVTNFNDLCEYAKGTVVKLPSFSEGQPFVARLRRPSLMQMARSGKIPNLLMKSAIELFDSDEGADSEAMLNMDGDALNSMMEVMDIICQSSMIEPSYEEVKRAGLELTDEQKMAIFNYAQTGVVALNSFR